jgi:HrpA-like RNA helicase
VTGSNGDSLSSLSTWEALCKDCRNLELRAGQSNKRARKAKGDNLRQQQYEYSDIHASRQFERGQSRSDRCPECRKHHKREIAAFPVAYIDVTAIGEASKYAADPAIGPTGPLGGLGPLPDSHRRRTEEVDLERFALGLKPSDIIDLLKMMQSHEVVILEAGTGTGKSTLVPLRLMNPPRDAPYRPTDIGPIVVTEPRVPATTEVAQFVGEAMCFGHDHEACFAHVGPGYPVGHQCEGKKNWDEGCSLIYVTDGTMVNWITNGDLARFSTVIVDEAHERSENIDLTLALLAAKLPSYTHLRVVIASATIDKTYFTKFFEKTPSIRVGHLPIDAQKQIGYGVPLFSDVEFTEEVLENGFTAFDSAGEPRFTLPGWSDSPNTDEGRTSLRALTRATFLDLRRPATDWPEKESVVAAAVEQTMAILGATAVGDVLVFMPNKNMVTDVQAKIEQAVGAASDALGKVDVYWLMRETKEQEKKRALAACRDGERKVVVASNLAETSLTIAGIKYVVDSGLISQAEWDPDLAVSHVPRRPHSQAGVKQRWGRVGRKTHGWVFPLYSLRDFLAMPLDTPAGSTQTNLEGTILRLIAAGEDPTDVVFPGDFEADGLTLDTFARESAERFRRERDRALLAAQTNGAVARDGKSLTPLGAELVHCRLSTEKAIALMFADRLACVPEVAMALVALGGKDDKDWNRGHLAGPGRILAADRNWPIEWNVHARKCHEALSLGCVDDLDLVVRIFAEWHAAQDPSEWCKRWWVNEDALTDLTSAARQLMDFLSPGMSKEADRPLDPRLAGRARAVLSRALGSLRYERTEGNRWRSTNPGQPGDVIVSPWRLIPAADSVIALARERPDEQGWGKVVAEGQILGLVSWLDWAAEDEPTDFELLRRVSQRRDELQEVLDPARTLRSAYPVGARVFVDKDAANRTTIVKLTEGLQRPEASPGLAALDDSEHNDTELVYTTWTDGSGETTRAKAGETIPEEEARLIPLPVAELETSELEDFSGHDSPQRTATAEFPRQASARTTGPAGRGHLQASLDSCEVVCGYEVDEAGCHLVLEAVPAEDEPSLRVDDILRVIVIGPISTHFGLVCEVERCDDDDTPLLTLPCYLDGATLDMVRGSHASALRPGSIWTVRVLPARSDYGGIRLSAADSLADLLSGATHAQIASPTGQWITAVLTGELYRDRRGFDHPIATTDAFGPTLCPEFAIWPEYLNKAGIEVAAGTRIGVQLAFTDRPMSGRWKPEDAERLVESHPGAFARGSSPEYLSPKAIGPLADESLEILREVDPTSDTYEVNAWQFWESSRYVTVKKVSVIAEATITPGEIAALRQAKVIPRIARESKVRIDIDDSGRITVAGRKEAVDLALSGLSSAVLEGRWSIALPRAPQLEADVYPGWATVRECLRELGEVGDDLTSRYNVSTGRIALLDKTEAIAVGSDARTALQKRCSYYVVHLGFSSPGAFSALLAWKNWESWTRGYPEVKRWMVEEGTSWGLSATSKEAVVGVSGNVRAALGEERVEVIYFGEDFPVLIEDEPLATSLTRNV